MGMWEKGEAIAAQFTGVKCAPSYRELERETGRRDISLKKWHKLYLRYPDREEYLLVAQDKTAEQWNPCPRAPFDGTALLPARRPSIRIEE